MGQNADGTQAPAPPAAFTDPLSGLVTGGTEPAAAPERVSGEADTDQFPVADPVVPDQSIVRGMVDATMAEGSEDQEGSADGKRTAPVQQVASGQPVGMLPVQQRRTWPVRPRLARQSVRPGRARVRKPPRPPGEPRRVKPSRGSTGLAVAVVLLALFGFLAVELLTSLFDAIAGLF